MPDDDTAKPEPAEQIQVPDTFEGLSEDDLRELHGRLQSRFEEERSAATTRAHADALRGYRQAQERIKAELENRQREAADVASALSELDEPIGLPDPAAPGEPEKPKAEGGVEGEGEAKPDAAAKPDATVPLPQAAAIAAARQQQTPAEQQPEPARAKVAMTAAAGQNIERFGNEISLARIGQAADSVKDAMKRADGETRAYIASLPGYESTPGLGVPILSDNNSVSENDRLIREAVEAHMARRAEWMGLPAPRTAAICLPLDIIREVPDYTTDADPLGDALPQRPAGRLGFTFTPAITLAELASGVQAGWNDVNQAAVNPANQATWKPCVDIACPTPTTVTAEAVTACVTFDVSTEMSNPERVRDILLKLSAMRTRVRTIRLLNLITGLSVNYTDTGDYGTWPAVVDDTERILERAVYAERLERSDYTLFLPPGLVAAIISDLQGKAYLAQQEYAEGQAEVLARLRSTFGVDVVDLMDEVTAPFAALPAVGAANAVQLPAHPASFKLRFVHVPSALYFSTGEMETGIQSDPQLARQNKRQWFSEEYVGLTKHGAPPWFQLTLTTCPSGARAGLSNPRDCTP